MLSAVDRRGHRDPVQTKRHRNHYQAEFPERSDGRREKFAQARRQDHRRSFLRRRR